MIKNRRVARLTFSSMFLALALVIPFLTGQIPQIGSMLCPMHIPVLLCGYVCGGLWGFLIGCIAPIMRSVTLGMPPMFPTAFCMAFELAVYGLAAGVMYRKFSQKKWSLFVSLVSAMTAGRLVWGGMMFACMGFDVSLFGFQAFIAATLLNSIPGIVLQLVLIPVLVMLIEKKHCIL